MYVLFVIDKMDGLVMAELWNESMLTRWRRWLLSWQIRRIGYNGPPPLGQWFTHEDVRFRFVGLVTKETPLDLLQSTCDFIKESDKKDWEGIWRGRVKQISAVSVIANDLVTIRGSLFFSVKGLLSRGEKLRGLEEKGTRLTLESRDLKRKIGWKLWCMRHFWCCQ